MKRVVFLLFTTFFLAGCSLTDTKVAFENFINSLLQKDQAHEQGFVLTASEVSTRFYRDETGIDLSKLGLTAVPDLCALVSPEEYDLVRFLDLSQNKIRIVDQNLDCFQYLQVINLSYNEIQQVVTLGTLPRLKDLRLQKNQITTTENFPPLTGLTRLNLAYNQITVVQDLEKLINLKELELQHNVIEEFIGAEKMQQLERLKLEFNKLSNVDFLKEIKSLFTVSVGGNQLPPEIEAIWKAFSPVFKVGGSGSVAATGAAGTGQ